MNRITKELEDYRDELKGVVEASKAIGNPAAKPVESIYQEICDGLTELINGDLSRDRANPDRAPSAYSLYQGVKFYVATVKPLVDRIEDNHIKTLLNDALAKLNQILEDYENA